MIVTALLAGMLATASPEPADVDAAAQAYRDCLDDAARTRDDGKTNPKFIGRHVALQCRPVMVKLVNLAASRSSMLVRDQLYQHKLTQEEAVGAAAVVRHRQMAGARP